MVKARRKKRKIGGPFLEAAFICEQTIREKDGTFSAIRMVNKLTLHESTFLAGTVLALPLASVISFKAGDFKGRKSLSVYVTNPSGKRVVMPVLEAIHWLEFQGGDTGVFARYPLYLVYDKSGTYWFDIVMDRRLRSRMPLTLVVENKPLSRIDQFGANAKLSRNDQ